MIKLLLVEDDRNLSYICKCSLEDMVGGYEVVTAENGKEGLAAYKQFHPDVIVADVEMPVMGGFEMVAKIRETDTDIPILFASALISPKDVMEGYKIGGNNYVKKPFVPEELNVHIQGLLKLRSGVPSRNESAIYQIGDFVLDAAHHILKKPDGTIKMLTMRASEILQLLCENRGEVVRREVILGKFWKTEDDYFASRSLDVFVTKLRKQFSDHPEIEIKSIRSIGIMLSVVQ